VQHERGPRKPKTKPREPSDRPHTPSPKPFGPAHGHDAPIDLSVKFDRPLLPVHPHEVPPPVPFLHTLLSPDALRPRPLLPFDPCVLNLGESLPEISARTLFSVVSWVRQLPAFLTINLADQVCVSVTLTNTIDIIFACS
jgi:hypothetical protein